MKVLVVNGGSSSLKTSLYDLPEGRVPTRGPAPLWDAKVDWGRNPGQADIQIKTQEYGEHKQTLSIQSSREVLKPVLDSLWSGACAVLQSADEIDVVGHRVVHGGRAFRETTVIDDRVRQGIAEMVEFAPEHNRLELEAIEAAQEVLGSAKPQIAVFDTAFHSTLEPAAYTYPVPRRWAERGVRRYGFHGISHQYTSRRAAELLDVDLRSLRMITCHLGNGSSLAAIANGRSVDTTMGFTPLEGLMMGTRSGSIDPGILIYLVRHRGYHADELDHALNKESGLLGISGLSADMREILKARSEGHAAASLAYEVYIHRLVKEIGSMIASMGGVDTLVFTAGVGENSREVRRDVCRRLSFLGVEIDPAVNDCATCDAVVNTEESRVRILIIRTQEDWEIARECHRVMTVEARTATAT